MRSSIYYRKYLLLPAMIVLSLPLIISAQEKPDSIYCPTETPVQQLYSEQSSPENICPDSFASEKKTPWTRRQKDALSNAFKYNPEFLKNEANKLRVRMVSTFQVPSIMVHPKSNLDRRLTFTSDPLTYVGADIGWNIFTFGYSFGLNSRNDKNNARLSFNTYARFFAINLDVLWINNLSISAIDKLVSDNDELTDDIYPQKIPIDGAYFQSRSLQFKFFPNGKKMTYGNTINPKFRQIKSAGTVVFTLGYADNDFNTNLENTDFDKYSLINEVGISSLNLSKYEIGGGYSYNFVVRKRWVLFLADIVGVSAKHYTYDMLFDNLQISKTNIGLSNRLRTGACYYNKDYYIGTNVSYEADILNTSQFLFNNTGLSGNIYIGYKFNIDGFNRFVSNMLKLNIE